MVASGNLGEPKTGIAHRLRDGIFVSILIPKLDLFISYKRVIHLVCFLTRSLPLSSPLSHSSASPTHCHHPLSLYATILQVSLSPLSSLLTSFCHDYSLEVFREGFDAQYLGYYTCLCYIFY